MAAFTDESSGDDCGAVVHWDPQEIQSCSGIVTAKIPSKKERGSEGNIQIFHQEESQYEQVLQCS